MGQISIFNRGQPSGTEDVMFSYDVKSTSKHFVAGTSLINQVDELTRYDDYEIIKRKKGLQIKQLGIYRVQNKITGYEITYKDGSNKTFTLKRVASSFNRFRPKGWTYLKLQYNEHLTDIDVFYSQDEINFIEMRTSKRNIFKVGQKVENGYNSFNKVDISQKNYTPIIAFETTFSKDCLKELFVYRCPVRTTKRKQKRRMTVVEINNLKKAPSLEDAIKAQKNIDMVTDFARQGMLQLKVVRNWQKFVRNSKMTNNSDSSIDKSSSQIQTISDVEKAREDYMQELEFGHDDEDEEEANKLIKKKEETKSPTKKNAFMAATRRILTAITITKTPPDTPTKAVSRQATTKSPGAEHEFGPDEEEAPQIKKSIANNPIIKATRRIMTALSLTKSLHHDGPERLESNISKPEESYIKGQKNNTSVVPTTEQKINVNSSPNDKGNTNLFTFYRDKTNEHDLESATHAKLESLASDRAKYEIIDQDPVQNDVEIHDRNKLSRRIKLKPLVTVTDHEKTVYARGSFGYSPDKVEQLAKTDEENP